MQTTSSRLYFPFDVASPTLAPPFPPSASTHPTHLPAHMFHQALPAAISGESPFPSATLALATTLRASRAAAQRGDLAASLPVIATAVHLQL